MLVKIDQAIAAHHEAAELAEQARDLLSIAGFGTLQADVDQACALFTRVIEGISEPEGQVSTLATVADEIRSYLRSQGIGQEPGGAVQSSQPPAPRSPERVEALRDQLPPPVQPGTGQRTHGRWFADNGDEVAAIVSGQDDASAQAWEMLRETDFPEPGAPVTVTHVETKVAVMMRQKGIQHATVVLNNRPCRDRYGCDTVVPVLLPEGSTLTVHAPNYRKTYTGGMRAPWQL
ncbi:DddA-like double-stranded DNA deaminase toxin [Lentzea sp. HUAS TT2]|uniref:DddA-like double-stranded DNA deaminase toxin n=1 Tax=Lentzea sp. HUAS TT2 TaxID=3447454 RepID=UPI003F727D24